MKIAVFLMVLGLLVPPRVDSDRVEVDDFRALVGKLWKGTVTTKLVESGEVHQQAMRLRVEQDVENAALFRFRYTSLDEGAMGVTREVEIAQNGKKVNRAEVLQVVETKIGGVEVVTEEKLGGKWQRVMYTIGRERFGMRLFEKGKGEDVFVEQIVWEFVVSGQ